MAPLPGIMALMATTEYYDATEIATRILPHLVVLTVDSDRYTRSSPMKYMQNVDALLIYLLVKVLSFTFAFPFLACFVHPFDSYITMCI
jgi:hypothetical protein